MSIAPPPTAKHCFIASASVVDASATASLADGSTFARSFVAAAFAIAAARPRAASSRPTVSSAMSHGVYAALTFIPMRLGDMPEMEGCVFALVAPPARPMSRLSTADACRPRASPPLLSQSA